MAFVRKNFERQAGGITKIHTYQAGADTLATVKGASYFDSIANEIDKGDIVHVISNNVANIDVAIFTSARGVTPVTIATTEADAAT